MKKLTLVLSMMIALIGLNANAAIYIVGNGPLGGWACDGGNEMTANGDGTYTYVVTIAADATSTSVYFVFADNRADAGDWTTFNNNYRIGPTSGDVEVQVTGDAWTPTQKAGGDNGAYFFKGTKGESYTVTYDETNSQFKVEGYVEPVTEFTYTVAGSSADLFGTAWDETNTANDMTLVNGLYTFTKNNVELTTAGFSFKVVENHDWGTAYPSSNYVQAIGTHGYYNVVITFNKDTKEITCTPTLVEEITDEEDPIYTVAGTPAALFGTEWAPSLTENEMTKGQDGIYTWTKKNVALTAGNVEFKVVLGHDWGVEYPSSNYVATIDANGNYDVTITFNPETGDISFNAAVVEETEDFYTVAGSPATIFGEEWNPALEANKMTLVDGLYTWTKEGVEMATGDVIEFKVVKNANWSTCYPESNWYYECPADGTYNLTITFNPETSEVTFDASIPGEQPVEITSYTVVGPESIFGTDWNPADEANNMVKGEDGIYTWTKKEVTLYGNFEFKVVGNHDYAIYEWPIGPNNWVANLTEGEGIYTIAITFNPEAADADRITCTLTKTGDIAPVEHVYTVAGTMNLFGSDWNPADEANNMVKGEDGIYTWTKDGVEFALEDVVEFKVVQDHAWAYAWPSSNWWWQCTEAGKYNVVITFDPAADDMNKITFTATLEPAFTRGDVNNDDNVNISDVTALIDYILSHDATGINLSAADCNMDENVNISDVTALIDFILSHQW